MEQFTHITNSCFLHIYLFYNRDKYGRLAMNKNPTFLVFKVEDEQPESKGQSVQ